MASATYQQHLLSLGMEADVLNILATERQDYELACRMAARFAGTELLHRLRRNENPSNPDVPGGVKFDATRLPGIISRTADEIEWARIGDEALDGDRKAVGAIEYMIATSPQLRGSIAELMQRWSDWSPNDSWQVESFLRLSLNEALGQRAGAIYAPAISRAEQIGKQHDLVLSILHEEVQTVVEELNPQAVSAPSVYSALIERSRGDPEGVVLEALEMRSKAAVFRKHLAKCFRDGAQSLDLAAIHREAKDIGRQLRIALGLLDEPSLWDAFQFHFVVGLPSVTISGSKLRDWIDQRLAQRRIVVLTDIARRSAFPDTNRDYFRRLLSESSGGRL